MSRFMQSAAIAALMVVPAAAGAVTTVDIPIASIGDGSGHLYSTDSAASGSLDLSSYLLDANGQTFSITDLAVQISATSPRTVTSQVIVGSQPVFATGQEAYRCGLCNSKTCYRPYTYFVGYTPVYADVDSTVDTLRLSMGSGQATASTVDQGGYNSEYYGTLSTGVSASPADLATINKTGTLNFGLQNLAGSMIALNSASVSFNLAALPAVAAVPEPASWAMMILGVGAIGVSLRHRRRRRVSPALAD